MWGKTNTHTYVSMLSIGHLLVSAQKIDQLLLKFWNSPALFTIMTQTMYKNICIICNRSQPASYIAIHVHVAMISSYYI